MPTGQVSAHILLNRGLRRPVSLVNSSRPCLSYSVPGILARHGDSYRRTYESELPSSFGVVRSLQGPRGPATCVGLGTVLCSVFSWGSRESFLRENKFISKHVGVYLRSRFHMQEDDLLCITLGYAAAVIIHRFRYSCTHWHL